MGGININTLTKTSISKEYLNLIQSEGFSQLIFEATRITENSQSCIDHIFTNISTSCSSGSLAVEIADHLPVFIILYDPKFSPFPDYFEFRDFRDFEKENFKNDLRRENWDSIYKCNEVNESYSRFLHIFNKVSNIHAPLKKANIKHKAYKPWITSGLMNSMKVRDKLYKKWLITRNYVFLNKYKLYRNKIANINKIYRDRFYNDILSKLDNTKKMWDNINLLINKKRPSSHIEKLLMDNKQYEQPLSISNCLNNFFCNVPSILASKLPKSNKSLPLIFLRNKNNFDFHVSEIEIILLLENLDSNKSFGCDKIHPLLLPTAAFQIYHPLTFIFNLSINQGIFPDSMKLAKVVPIFKQGSRFMCNNYRPISVDLIEEITSSLDQGHYVVSLFLDLSKAFDTVNHQILLNKLKFYGLQQSEYNWIQSYLSNRKQQVYVNGVASDSCLISTGVPQGSIRGPLLFIIFINDLPKTSTFFSTRLYADDTSLTASGSDLDSLLCEINNHLPAIYEWLCSNKLTLNLTKTKYIIFMPRQKESYNLYPPLTVANVYLEKSSCVKYLGVYIDCHLTWHDHIDYICNKISKNVNIMVKLKRHVSKATLVSLYYSLIYPYLTYACTLWGNNYNAPLSQIVKLQNKAVRVINDVPLMEPITPHYLSLHLLKFPDIVKLNTCMLFYDYFHHEKFRNISVSLVSELHNYNTRSASSNQIFIPSFRTNLRRFCPSIIGCFFWNNIGIINFIRDKLSKKLFRKALLHWYLAQY